MICNGSIRAEYCQNLKYLKNIEEINGNLILSYSGIENLGKLKKVNGNLFLQNFK